MNKTKTLTAICCAALLAPALYAQRPEHAALIAQEARGNADAAFRLDAEGSVLGGEKGPLVVHLGKKSGREKRGTTNGSQFLVHGHTSQG